MSQEDKHCISLYALQCKIASFMGRHIIYHLTSDELVVCLAILIVFITGSPELYLKII